MALKTDLRADPTRGHRARPHVGVGAADAGRGRDRRTRAPSDADLVAAEPADRVRLAADRGHAVRRCSGRWSRRRSRCSCRRRRSRRSRDCRAPCSCRPPRSPGWRSRSASAARCRWLAGSRRKGLSPAAAVTFMLAAPIVNPVVIASTYVAYRGRDSLGLMVIGRLHAGADRRDVRRLGDRRAPSRRPAARRRRRSTTPTTPASRARDGSSPTCRATSSSWRGS